MAGAARRVLGLDLDPTAVVAQADDLPSAADLTTGVDHVGGVGLGDGGEVDDRRLRGVDRSDAGDVGLELVQLGRVDAPHAGTAVGQRATQDLVEAVQLGRVGGDHHLAALVVRDAPLRAVRPEALTSIGAQASLQRARARSRGRRGPPRCCGRSGGSPRWDSLSSTSTGPAPGFGERPAGDGQTDDAPADHDERQGAGTVCEVGAGFDHCAR